MKYTFSEAKRRLRQFAGSSGARNTGEVINTAIEALAASKGLAGSEAYRTGHDPRRIFRHAPRVR